MKKLIFIILYAVAAKMVLAQTESTIVFSYDMAGNRTGRSISLEKIKAEDSIITSDQIVTNGTEVIQTTEELSETIGNKVISVYPNPTEGLLKVNITNFGEIYIHLKKNIVRGL
jgi:hypothetical protein